MMLGKVALASGAVYRPAAYALPPVRPVGRRLGQSEVRLNWGNLGKTVLFGSMGAGAIYGSGLLPDPVKTVAMVSGIGLIGYAAYSFIGSSAKEDGEIPVGTGSQITSAADFNAIRGQFQQPKDGSSQGFQWFQDEYDVKVLLSNPTPRPVSLTVELIATEYPKVLLFIPTGSYDNYLAGSKTITIPANSNLEVEFEPSVKVSRWLSARMKMELTLRKIRVGGEVADLDHVTFTLMG